LPQQLPGPAHAACVGELPQQEVSAGPGTLTLATPDNDEGAESSFFKFTLPQDLHFGEFSDELTSTSLVAPHSTHENS
jgi:hypothetical protein